MVKLSLKDKQNEVIFMDLNLRHAILENIKENNQEQLEATIVDAIEREEEKMLPGLGVLFEIIWKQSQEDQRNEMIDTLEQGIKATTQKG